MSYLTEIPVEQVSSTVSGQLKVSLMRGKYCLSTKNAVYSFDVHYSSFKTAFEKLHISKRVIGNCLILGYGLGSIPLLLNKKHGIHPRFVAVELDPQVLRLAEKYGYLPITVAVVQDDAEHYVFQATETFDLINADLYVDDTTPPQFEREVFLVALKRMLAPKGLLLYSRFYYDTLHRKLTDDFRKNVFEKIFPGSSAIQTRGNLMLVWENI